MKKIYVGNLSWGTSDSSLRDAFGAFGEVHSATVVLDRETGRSRGFGFVEMDDADADEAIASLDGQDLDGRALRVNQAQDRNRGPRSGGGGGGGGGRHGGGGGGGGRW